MEVFSLVFGSTSGIRLRTAGDFTFTSLRNLIHCSVTISSSFNLSMSLCFGEKLILSQFVQLVRHVRDYVSSCWEVDYQQIKHFQLLQGDMKFL